MIGRIVCMALVVTILCLFVVLCQAAIILNIHIEKDAWTWTGDSVATFKGTVVMQGASENDPVTLRLSVICEPDGDQTGDAVFTSVNDRQLTVRKQKSEYLLTGSETATTRFTGSWYVPEDGQYSRVTIRVEAVASDGSVIRDALMQVINDAVYSDDSISRLPDPDTCIRPVLIAAGVIWFLAIIRIIINKRRR